MRWRFRYFSHASRYARRCKAVREEIAALRPIALYLAGYFLYGAGYIAYMTFMIAYIREAGGDAYAQSAFWCLIGIGGMLSPWTWRPIMARGRDGIAMALTIGLTGIGAALALIASSAWMYAISAFVFGNAFLAVVIALTPSRDSTTRRRNGPGSSGP